MTIWASVCSTNFVGLSAFFCLDRTILKCTFQSNKKIGIFLWKLSGFCYLWKTRSDWKVKVVDSFLGRLWRNWTFKRLFWSELWIWTKNSIDQENCCIEGKLSNFSGNCSLSGRYFPLDWQISFWCSIKPLFYLEFQIRKRFVWSKT